MNKTVSEEEGTDFIRRYEKRVVKAKRLARSELSVSRGDWTKFGYAWDPDFLSTRGLKDEIPRVHCSSLTVEDFMERFERPKIPVIITGLTDSWPAQERWTMDSLLRAYGEHKFKVGTDDDGYPVRLKFKYFYQYCNDPRAMRDDSPLYVFDGSFASKQGSRPLLGDYTVPPYFEEDLFQHAGTQRPPYRWVVMGPARSGSCLHVDPLATSAWNTVLQGHKRWVLFPPEVPREALLPQGLEREAVHWFSQVYPKTRSPSWPYAKPIDLIQGPGETVYVPGGYWHAVLNLDSTVAVTQNFCSSVNFAAVWKQTRKGRPKMSQRWLGRLREVRPDLAAVADDIEGRGDYDQATTSSSSSSSSSSDSGSDSDGRGKEDRSGGDLAALPSVSELYPYIIPNPRAQEPWRFRDFFDEGAQQQYGHESGRQQGTGDQGANGANGTNRGVRGSDTAAPQDQDQGQPAATAPPGKEPPLKKRHFQVACS